MAFLDETGLAELWSLVKAEDNVVKAFADTKAKIVTGSYTGTGTYGSSNKMKLTFDKLPTILIIQAESGGSADNTHLLLYGVKRLYDLLATGTAQACDVTYGSNYISWYGSNAGNQANLEGWVYKYIGIY